MTCSACGDKPQKAACGFSKAVVEIDNPERIVLIRKVLIPASMGDETVVPPSIGKYHNVLLEYEASGGIYLYSSDGIPTKLSSDVTELQAQLNALRVRIGEEEVARADADTALSDRITSLDNSLATVARTGSYDDLSNKPTIGNGTLTIKKNGSNVGTFTANATTNKNIDISVPTKTSDLTNDGSDGTSTYVEASDLATVATSGSYNDLTNKPTIGNATLTIKRNDASAGTFTANATTNKSINIAVPTKTSDLTNDGSDGTSTYVESDDLPTVDTTYSSSSNNAIANSTVTNSLDRNVMTNLALDSTPSTTTVNLNNTKTNLASPSSTTTSSISLPVASSTQAGVMNSATFDAVTNNTNNINAIMNGAVAVSGLPASPTQAELTTAWENETGLPSLINRASVYDVTNNKVWTYYTNDQTWHAASNTSQVTVNTFTNSSEGTIKGSTNEGQVFAENDGTGSVNGWDVLNSAVSSNTSKLATIAQGAEVNVQSDWTQTNTSADDYIKNKPANLVQDANYVHTDNNFTTTLKNKLDGIESGAEVNVQADWSQSDTTADDYIKNKPTIPTVNNATLTIQKNGTNVQTFTANSSTNKTANITVPTAVSELTNDSGYATTTQLNDGLATKQDTLTAGDNIQINGNTISATDTTYTAGNAIDITNGEISADIHPADFFTAEDTISDCGSDLSLDDTMASTLRSVELKGDTYQQSYSGKNLFNAASGPNINNLVSDVSFDENTYTLSVPSSSSTSSGNRFTGFYVTSLQEGTTYTISYLEYTGDIATDSRKIMVRSYDGSSATTLGTLTSDKTQSFTVPVGSQRIEFFFYTTQGTTSTFSKIQLEEGSVATSYEPYTGGIPAPSPDYPQDIQVVTGEQTVEVCGKNLIGYESPNFDAYFEGSGSQIAASSNNRLYYIKCKYNATYSITTPAIGTGTVFGGGCRVGITNELPAVGVAVPKVIKSGAAMVQPSTYTTTAEDGYFVVRIQAQNGSGLNLDQTAKAFFDACQIEFGSTATSYEPYQGQFYGINLGKNLFTTTNYSGNVTITGSNSFEADIDTARTANMFFSPRLPAGTYTLSYDVSKNSTNTEGIRCGVYVVDGNGTSSLVSIPQYDGHIKYTFTSTTEVDRLYFFINSNMPSGSTASVSNIQVEAGISATSFAPYFTPIELCKIGDYQDYIYKSGDDWYVKKNIGKITLDGTETWSAAQMTNNWMYYTINAGMATVTSSQMPDIISNYFSVATTDGQWTSAAGSKSVTLNNAVSPNTQIRFTVGDNTNKLTDFKTWLSTHNTTVYYALTTPADTQITNTTLVAQLDALAGARSYNDQTNIIVTAAGDNLLATLCVETYRKSLDGVIEAIDNACTCRNNLVVYLPNGMTTYTNDDAPIPISEVSEAFKRGQSVFLVDEAPERYGVVYTVTAVDMDDGIWSMRADQTGVNPRRSDGYWHINGGGDVWSSVTFINDTTPLNYTPNIFDRTWFAFTSSTPLLDQHRRTYYPASSDVTFNNNQENVSVAELWAKLASSSWNGNPVILQIPLQGISTRTTDLVDTGFSAESPHLIISVSLGPDNYFERETSEYMINGWAAECTPIAFGGKETYTVGIVRVVENGNTTYSFVVSLTEVEDQ